MANPAKQYLEILIDDWQDRGQRISDRARNTFNELALLAEQVVLSGGDDKIVESICWREPLSTRAKYSVVTRC